jgi:hypothetical protein
MMEEDVDDNLNEFDIEFDIFNGRLRDELPIENQCIECSQFCETFCTGCCVWICGKCSVKIAGCVKCTCCLKQYHE